MKILHSSDWHLGQNFMGKSREPEHKAFLTWLIDLIRTEAIDAVIVAGDIFDTGTPPSYARALYNDLVVKMHQEKCQLAILGGNHDSVATLHESADLLKCLGAHVIGNVQVELSNQVITLFDKANKPGAILSAIPFIRARDVVESHAAQSGQEKQQALITAMATHFDDVFQLACQQRDALDKVLPIISTGHLTTLASAKSESVREIYVGTLESFPSDRLPPADYVALGHIHKPMSVSGKEHIRYSGSPIHLSFDELGHDKQVQIVEFNGSANPEIRSVDIPRFRQMVTVSGSLEEVKRQLKSIQLQDTYGDMSCWVEISVHTDDYLSDLQQQLESLIDDKPVEILRILRQRNPQDRIFQSERRHSLRELAPKEVFMQRLAEESLDNEAQEQLVATFDKVAAEVTAGEELIDSELLAEKDVSSEEYRA